MDIFAQIVVKIIKAQEAIIGPIAVEQAKRIPHIKVDWNKQQVSIDGNESEAVGALIEIYEELFGQISVEVSKEAAAPLMSQLSRDQLPEALK